MLMNSLEFWAMNNPLRALVQDKIEARTLRKFTSSLHNKTVLEIGCGNGNGAKLIKRYFKPQKIFGIDLDPKMISVAKKKNSDKNITFSIGDAAQLSFKDNFFDAIFDFAIIHHIPNWKDCLRDLRRVLKPGGMLIIEDLSIETFENNLLGKIFKNILKHPYSAMYTRNNFLSYLEDLDFIIKTKKQYSPLGFHYFIVIAEKQ